MRTLLTTLSLAAAALLSGHAHAQAPKAALVQDVERPNGKTIVSARIATGGCLACAVYTVPAGKILHVTQLSFNIQGYKVNLLEWSFGTFANLPYVFSPNERTIKTDKVDFYVPAGRTLTIFMDEAGAVAPPNLFVEASMFGTLSDE